MPAPHSTFPCFNAIVLAGGRSSRLNGTPKALLRSSGRTLLATALDAAAAARAVAVAGPPELRDAVQEAGGTALLVREDPPFTGPAAAVGAAWSALAALDAAAGHRQPDWTLVLACDMPFISRAVGELLAAAAAGERDPAVGSDQTGAGHRHESLLAVVESGRAQPLAALYRTAALGAALYEADRPGGLENLSMKRLLARVQWRNIAVPAHSTADIDTWEDARRWSVEPGSAAQT